jgi:uncharacterized protein YjbJ (UPF0337 family)
MTIGTSIFLIALGAILAFAVNATVAGFSIQTAGVILMVAGVVGLVIGLFLLNSRRARPAERTVYDDRTGRTVYEDRPQYWKDRIADSHRAALPRGKGRGVMKSGSRDKAEGTVDKIAGRVMEAFSKLTGNRSAGAKGKAARGRGAMRKTKGRAKRAK